MKYKLLSLTITALMLCSCVREYPIFEEGVDVSILIAMGGETQTRSETHPGSGIDSDIDHFRVLIFDSKSGLLKFKSAFTPPQDQYEIEMRTGVYDFVVIANDYVDEEGAYADLNALTIGSSRISDLNDISFASSSFDEVTKIPMLSVVRGVKVKLNNEIDLPSGVEGVGVWNPTSKVWTVELVRLAVRVDLKIKLSEGQTVDASKKLSVDRVPACVYLFPRDNDAEYEEIARTYDIPAADGEYLTWKRIILPESMFSDKSESGNGVVISLTVNDSDCESVIGLDTKNADESKFDYTLPRNTYLDITATANPQQQALDCSASVVPWNEYPEQNVIVDDQYFLKVAADDLLFTEAEGSAEITAKTNYDLTEDKQGYPAGIKVSVSGSDWITDLMAETTDNKNYIIRFKVSELENLSNRTAKIKVQAGNMTKIINVKQALWGGHADILYFDPDDNYRLKVGRWGVEITPDNYQNIMVFTKFGSVVGFTIEGANWSNSYIKFNPSDYSIGSNKDGFTITGYAPPSTGPLASNNLPYIPGFTSTYYDNNYGLNISSPEYHNYENIKKGRGDICQLLGLTADQIKGAASEENFKTILAARDAKYQGWRLPTARENASFVGGSSDNSTWIKWKNENENSLSYASTTNETGSSSTWPYYYDNDGNRSKSEAAGAAGSPATARFPVVTDSFNDEYTQVLPAAGYRLYNRSTVYYAGTSGYYWSSTPFNNMYGSSLSVIYSGSVRPVHENLTDSGLGVRCVRPVNNLLKY